MSRLKMPDYITNSSDGKMIAIGCKVCGEGIAGTDAKGFYRFANYGEMKMKFRNGEFHVTNLCHKCMETARRDVDLMYELFCADIDLMAKEIPSLKALKNQGAPLRCVATDTRRLGIV